MSSKNYDRAQAMVMTDKYNAVKDAFYAELTNLAKRYFEVDGVVTDVYCGETLQLVITLSVKKVKIIRSVTA